MSNFDALYMSSENESSDYETTDDEITKEQQEEQQEEKAVEEKQEVQQEKVQTVEEKKEVQQEVQQEVQAVEVQQEVQQEVLAVEEQKEVQQEEQKEVQQEEQKEVQAIEEQQEVVEEKEDIKEEQDEVKDEDLELIEAELSKKEIKIKKHDTDVIEKNIILTWKEDVLPKKFQINMNKIKEIFKDYNIIFFNDRQILKFIKVNYMKYYKFYKELISKQKIMGIDFFRYLAIYHYGGFYLDLDMVINKSFNDLLKYECIFPKEYNHNTDNLLLNKGINILIGQYAFGARKNHPFIKFLIDNLFNERIKNSQIPSDNKKIFKQKQVLYKTGPVLVTLTHHEYEKKEEILLLETDPFEYSCFGNYGKHLNYGSWKSPNSIKKLN